MDSTGENFKGNGDNDLEQDGLLQDLIKEFECKEERGPPIHKKLKKILKDLLWRVLKKEKLEKVVMDKLLPKNLENLEKALVNPEILRKVPHKTKFVDLRLQEIQKLILKSDMIVVKIMNMLYEAKQNQESNMLEFKKNGIR